MNLWDEGKWFRIHNTVLDEYDGILDMADVAVYTAIARCCKSDGTGAYPSYSWIAHLAKCSRKTAVR